MDIFQVIRDRRSIRKYVNKEVEQEKVDQVLDAARLAPSWKNMQCWRFLVIRDEVNRDLLLEAVPDENPGKKALAVAPVTIMLCADPREYDVENGIPYYVADGAIAFEHLCLAAHALGLGTCWIGWYDEAKIKEAFSIPDPIRVIGFTPLGYPDQEPKPRPRKSLDDIVHYDVWPSNE